MQSINQAATINLPVLEAEVPPELLKQLEALDNALKENKRIYADIKDIKPASDLATLEIKMTKLGRLIGQQKSMVHQERMKTAALAEKIGLDKQVGQNILKSREQSSKNPQYGRAHSLDYLHEVATLNERQLDNLWSSVQKLRQMLERLQSEDAEPTEITRSDLAAHIQRFDKIFETVATQVYTLNESTEKLRDCYLEQRKDIFGGDGPFGVSPFEKRKERQRLIDAYSSLKGVDAFPSPNAILSLSEYLPKQQAATAQPQFGATPFGQPHSAFGAGAGLFGAAPKATLAFSFNQPPPSSGAAASSSSLFGSAPKSVPAPLFGLPSAAPAAVPPLFGAIQPTTTATTTSALPPSIPLFGAATSNQLPAASTTASATSQSQPPPFGFSNTLSSASSGTLFKGSASPQRSGPLFGGLSK